MEMGKIDLTRFSQPVTATVLVMGNSNVGYAMRAVGALRDENIATVAYLDADKKFKNQIEYADKINTKYSIIVGEDEVKNESFSVKDMASGEQKNMPLNEMIKLLKNA